MSTKEYLVKEFEVRVFEESYERIYKCLQLLNEDELWSSPNANIPTVGNLILHLCGNARQWILSGIGEKEDNRNRDQEFVIHRNIKKSDLVFLLENLRSNLKETLRNLTEEKIARKYQIQVYNVTGFSVIVHVLEHFSYHTGQITTLTKLLKNQQTGYFETLDLNQLNQLNKLN